MTDNTDIHKNHITLRMSADQLYPRRGHIIHHPITAEEQNAYDELTARWRAAEAEWDAVVAEAERRGWGTGVHGYEYEPAELRPLTGRTEWVSTETDEEWAHRVATEPPPESDLGRHLRAVFADVHRATDAYAIRPAYKPMETP